jgi:hypothetical protein
MLFDRGQMYMYPFACILLFCAAACQHTPQRRMRSSQRERKRTRTSPTPTSGTPSHEAPTGSTPGNNTLGPYWKEPNSSRPLQLPEKLLHVESPKRARTPARPRTTRHPPGRANSTPPPPAPLPPVPIIHQTVHLHVHAPSGAPPQTTAERLRESAQGPQGLFAMLSSMLVPQPKRQSGKFYHRLTARDKKAAEAAVQGAIVRSSHHSHRSTPPRLHRL